MAEPGVILKKTDIAAKILKKYLTKVGKKHGEKRLNEKKPGLSSDSSEIFRSAHKTNQKPRLKQVIKAVTGERWIPGKRKKGFVYRRALKKAQKNSLTELAKTTEKMEKANFNV